MKTKRHGRGKPAAPKVTLHRETLRHLADDQLQRAAGQFQTRTCPGTGVTCSGWPPCTC
jgi:hypothetical protein